MVYHEHYVACDSYFLFRRCQTLFLSTQGFICPICKKGFDEPEKLQEHFDAAHESPTGEITANR